MVILVGVHKRYEVFYDLPGGYHACDGGDERNAARNLAAGTASRKFVQSFAGRPVRLKRLFLRINDFKAGDASFAQFIAHDPAQRTNGCIVKIGHF